MTMQRLYIWDDKSFEFINYRDVHPRQNIVVENDPIVKHRFVIDANEFYHGVALRRSGKVDLYYNCTIVCTSEEVF
jgi:hypothetical protein